MLTNVLCVCGQRVWVSDEHEAIETECGGEGEGACAAFFPGDPDFPGVTPADLNAALAKHEEAVREFRG